MVPSVKHRSASHCCIVSCRLFLVFTPDQPLQTCCGTIEWPFLQMVFNSYYHCLLLQKERQCHERVNKVNIVGENDNLQIMRMTCFRWTPGDPRGKPNSASRLRQHEHWLLVFRIIVIILWVCLNQTTPWTIRKPVPTIKKWLDAFPQDIVALVASVLRSIKDTTPHCGHALQRSLKAHHGMGWDGMGWDGMGWDGMGWDGMGCWSSRVFCCWAFHREPQKVKPLHLAIDSIWCKIATIWVEKKLSLQALSWMAKNGKGVLVFQTHHILAYLCWTSRGPCLHLSIPRSPHFSDFCLSGVVATNLPPEIRSVQPRGRGQVQIALPKLAILWDCFPGKKWDVSLYHRFIFELPKNSTHQHHKIILCVPNIWKKLPQKYHPSKIRGLRCLLGEASSASASLQMEIAMLNCRTAWRKNQKKKKNSQASAAPTCKCQKAQEIWTCKKLHSENWKTHVLYISLCITSLAGLHQSILQLTNERLRFFLTWRKVAH